MTLPDKLAERREKMRLYMAERRKDPVQAQRNRDAVKKWREANAEKANAATRAWRAANPERAKASNNAWRIRQDPAVLAEYDRQNYRKTRRNSHLINKFGITSEQYETMVIAQDHHCALCPRPDLPEKRLAVDHDHKTGKVRALLCDPCNRGIGLLDEEPQRLRAAADYLELYRS